MTNRIFIIGDIHGCSATLRWLVDVTLQPHVNDRIYLLGDTIDRGPDSKGVLDFIFELRERGLFIESICGNHEEMFRQASRSSHNLGLWSANGGQATLASFQADGIGDIPQRYRDLLDSLPLYILLDDFVLVHAGLNFGVQDPFSDAVAMLWTRDSYVDPQRIGGRRLICGHTPVSLSSLEASLDSSKIMLDNGCVFGGLPETGRLAALELKSVTLYLQANIDLN